MLFATLLTFGLSGAAIAGAPSTGLGQAWPNAPDVSLSPSYHAYVFVLRGVQYIQINDTAGHVLGSIGTSAGQFIVLPIGRYAQQVSTPQQTASTTGAVPAAVPTTVYNDGSTTVTATPMSDGTTKITAASICTDPAACGSH
jgi:hypothetical protein